MKLVDEDVETKPRVPAKIALEVARQFVRFLKPRCERIIVAGSLRRRKPFVRDVEILYIGRRELVPDKGDLFGAQTSVDATERAIAVLLELGLIAKRPKSDGTFTWGPQNKLAIHVESGLPVDLFSATRETWFNYLVCRTGGAKNNVRICNAAIARGWKWNPYGEGFARTNPDERRVVTSEREVFDFVGLPYLEPWER